MALNVCLPDLLATKKISQATYDRMKPAYDELVAQFEGAHGRVAAESMATVKVLEGFELDLARRKRQALLQGQAQGKWLATMRQRAGLDAAGKPAPLRAAHAAEAMRAMDYDRQGITNQAFGMIEGLLEKHRRDLTGRVRDKAGLQDVVDELHGADSGSLAARELAEAWTRTAEWLRSRYNAAGGHIAKLDGWALPQLHDGRAIADAGFAAWRDFTVPLLDRAKILDHSTGLPMGDGKLELMLRDMWQAIGSEGWSRREPSGATGGRATGNRRTEHRVLHFTDGKAWSAYAERFGGRATALDAMIGHVRGMARDVAAMQHMGPNPEATLRWQQDWLEKSGADYLASDRDLPAPSLASRLLSGTTADQAVANARGGSGKLQSLWNEYSGRNSISANPRLSMLFSALAAQQAAAKLGGAFLRSFGDLGTVAKTAMHNDIPVTRVMKRYLELMAPGSHDDRRLAARLGIISEEWTRALSGDFRLTGEEMTHELTRRMADFVMRTSLLARHTEAAQMAFGMEAMGAIAHTRHLRFDQLDAGFAAMLERYGIGAERWDQLRATPTEAHGGQEWIMPGAIADEGLRGDLHRMLAAEGRHAVTVSDLDTRAMMGGLAPRGTLHGELLRSAFLFKAFPLTLLSLHGRRMLQQSSLPAKLSYGFTLLALTTAGGALSEQLSSIKDGKDPQDMTTAGFWGRAVLAGGGVGIFGDLIKQSENRFGGGIAQTLVGPLLGQTAGNVAQLAVADPIKAARGEDVNWRKDALRVVSSETPGLSLWYVRAALNRLYLDQAKEWADPDGYAKSYAKAEQFAADQDTGYWAPPGSMTGNGRQMRGIDWSNAIGRPQAADNVERQAAAAME